MTTNRKDRRFAAGGARGGRPRRAAHDQRPPFQRIPARPLQRPDLVFRLYGRKRHAGGDAGGQRAVGGRPFLCPGRQADGRHRDRVHARRGRRGAHRGRILDRTVYRRADAAAGRQLRAAATVEKYRAALEKSGAALADRDIVSPLWADVRPALPNTPCELLTPAQTGAAVAEKLAAVRAELRKAGATALGRAAAGLPGLAAGPARGGTCPARRWPWRSRSSRWMPARCSSRPPPARGRRGRAGRKRRGAARLRRVPALSAQLR